jgi:hypothetical protein
LIPKELRSCSFCKSEQRVRNILKGKELRMLCLGKRAKVRSPSRLGVKVRKEWKRKEIVAKRWEVRGATGWSGES